LEFLLMAMGHNLRKMAVKSHLTGKKAIKRQNQQS